MPQRYTVAKISVVEPNVSYDGWYVLDRQQAEAKPAIYKTRREARDVARNLNLNPEAMEPSEEDSLAYFNRYIAGDR